MTDFGDPTITFGEDTTYGCSVNLALNDLRDYCQNAAQIKDLPLFKNLEFIKKYGQFGNANIYNPKDWEDIKQTNTASLLGTTVSQWSDSEKQCKLYSSVHYTIYYAKMGFSDNPQNYIVDVYRSSQAATWTFKKPFENQQQPFTHYVSVQYIEVSQANMTSLNYKP